MAKCLRCDGCGQTDNNDDWEERESWTAWEQLPPSSKLFVTLGLVFPVPCYICEGSGVVPEETASL